MGRSHGRAAGALRADLGDGGIYAREIAYDSALGMTTVQNGKNHAERYWDRRGLVSSRCTTPLGHETRAESKRYFAE